MCHFVSNIFAVSFSACVCETEKESVLWYYCRLCNSTILSCFTSASSMRIVSLFACHLLFLRYSFFLMPIIYGILSPKYTLETAPNPISTWPKMVLCNCARVTAYLPYPYSSTSFSFYILFSVPTLFLNAQPVSVLEP